MAGTETAPLLGGEDLQGLDDINVRHGFIQKVYGILGCQLTVTTLVGGTVMHYGEIWAKANPALVMTVLWGSLIVSFGLMFVFICCPDTMRQTPLNYIILCAFTLAESVMVGFICIQYTKESVLIALAITALVVCALTLFACQTSYDFTGFGPYLFVACIVLMGFGFVLSIAGYVGGTGEAWTTARLVYSACGALLFSMYIVYDTQLIVGGKHSRCQFSIDDYAMAAISLYIDIVQLFLYLLQLFGERR
jgi:hypothetical protein